MAVEADLLDIDPCVRKYNQLAGMAEKSNVWVLLELLSALYFARDEAAKRDRLTTAIIYVQHYGKCRKPEWLKPEDLRLMEQMAGSQQTTVREIFDLISGLPLRWGPDTPYGQYAALPAAELVDLFQGLLASEKLEAKIGAYIVVARKYLEIYEGLLELTRLKRTELRSKKTAGELERSDIWWLFMFSSPLINGLWQDYSLIDEGIFKIQLPAIPITPIGGGQWLLSQELLTGTLMCAYVHLLEQIEDNSVWLR